MRVLVTGGGGFLGGAVVRELLSRGHDVRSISRGRYPELEAMGVACFQTDLAEAGPELTEALQGVECVIHCAAKAGVSGSRASYMRANFEGTQKLLAAAKTAGVKRFVHTSSPSVCFDGTDHINAGPDLPHASKFLAPYPESKALAEKAVLASNGQGDFHTCALRPHLIFGPGDPHLLPKLLARARAGRLMQVGPGTNEVSMTYVENGALAHVMAAEGLSADAPIAGHAYFVNQSQPISLWTWIGELLAALDLPPVKRKVSLRFAYNMGALLENLHKWLGRKGDPAMSRFIAQQLATSHSYDISFLERDLGYAESVDMQEATRRTVQYFREL